MSESMNRGAETHSFDDIVKGFQYAVNSAQEMLAAQHLDSLAKYFNPDGTAVTQTVKTASDASVEVPLMALVPHNTLAIDEIEINFATKIRHVTDRTFRGHAGETHDVDHAGLAMDFSTVTADDDDAVRVRIKFRVIPQPEALSRIIDEQCKQL